MMKNTKRLLTGILAAVMMISSAQLPSGAVYAAEEEVLEIEAAVKETASEEVQADIVEEQDNQVDTATEQDITVEKSEKNKGSVTISGIGPNYGGDVVVKFEIYRKQICY